MFKSKTFSEGDTYLIQNYAFGTTVVSSNGVYAVCIDDHCSILGNPLIFFHLGKFGGTTIAENLCDIPTCAISADGNFVVVTDSSMHTTIYSVANQSCKSEFSFESEWQDILSHALTQDGGIVASLQCDGDEDTTKRCRIELRNWRRNSVTFPWSHDCADGIPRIFKMSNCGSTLAILSSTHVIIVSSASGNRIHSWDVRSCAKPSLAMDASGNHVVVANNGVRIIATGVKSEQGRKLFYDKSFKGGSGLSECINCVAVSADGKYAAVLMQSKFIHICESRTSSRLLTLTSDDNRDSVKDHSRYIVCTFSETERVIFAIRKDMAIVAWNLEKYLDRPVSFQTSVLEETLKQVILNENDLNRSVVLTQPYLRRVLKQKHLRSLSDLFAGHNLLLLAIRDGSLSLQNFSLFDDGNVNPWRNFYKSAYSNLTSEMDLKIVDIVVSHAENVGIVKKGSFNFSTRLSQELSWRQLLRVSQVLNGLSQRVLTVEAASRELTNENFPNSSILDYPAGLSNSATMSANDLSKCLSFLHVLLRDGDVKAINRMLIRCNLLIVHVLGGVIPDHETNIAEVYSSFGESDIVSDNLNPWRSQHNQPLMIDLSNLQLACYTFSENCLKHADIVVATAVEIAVQRSTFKSTAELRNSLTEYIISRDVVDSNLHPMFMNPMVHSLVCSLIPSNGSMVAQIFKTTAFRTLRRGWHQIVSKLSEWTECIFNVLRLQSLIDASRTFYLSMNCAMRKTIVTKITGK